MNTAWTKLIGLAACGLYFLNAALRPEQWHFIDSINLIFHEAGHAIFFWAPQWMNIAGGSAFQILLPLALAVTAWRQGRPVTAALLLLWTGESCVNVSVYAGDALKMQLPLISDYAEHDWNWLLWRFGLLRHTAAVAGAIRVTGWISLVGGLLYGTWASFEEQEPAAMPLAPPDDKMNAGKPKTDL